jgi:hypothetical protein
MATLNFPLKKCGNIDLAQAIRNLNKVLPPLPVLKAQVIGFRGQLKYLHRTVGKQMKESPRSGEHRAALFLKNQGVVLGIRIVWKKVSSSFVQLLLLVTVTNVFELNPSLVH